MCRQLPFGYFQISLDPLQVPLHTICKKVGTLGEFQSVQTVFSGQRFDDIILKQEITNIYGSEI